MSSSVTIEFVPLDGLRPQAGPEAAPSVLVAFAADDLALSPKTREIVGSSVGRFERAAAVANFKGKNGSAVDIFAPEGLGFDRLLVLGTGKGAKVDALEDTLPDHVGLGGALMGRLGRGVRATVLFDLPEPPGDPAAAAAELALGIELRAYRFDVYRTKKKDEGEREGPVNVAIAVADPAGAKAAREKRAGLAEGVGARARPRQRAAERALVPRSSPTRAEELTKLGVEVEVLDEKAMKKLGMGALLGVGQGSARESRGSSSCAGTAARRADKPVAFVGKGVVFDTGGISIKPAAGMEDMKGDMARRRLRRRPDARARRAQGQGQCRSASSASSRTCRTATPSAPATSSPRCRARPSRSSTPTPKAASCSPTCSGTCRTASSRNSWSTSRR